LKQELIAFANCLSEAFSSSRVSPLNNFSLKTYLPVLRLESLIKLYESIKQASNSQLRRLDPEIPNLVANEIVFRSLVKIPRNFAPLKEFLAAYFPKDRLLDSITRIVEFEIPPLYPRVKDLLDFDLFYLDALRSFLETQTQFSSAIRKVLSRFSYENYSVNLLFAVDKDFTDDEVSLETKQTITEHFLDGFVRQVVTDRQPAWAGIIFDEESQVGKLFMDTARRAQEAMGDYLRRIDFYRYQFVEDEQTPLFFHEGSSGGLAFAELYYLAQASLRSPLAPYTAFVGALNERQEFEAVANIEAKIQAAKEYGIRILILPESNREQVSLDEADGNLQLLSYKEGFFSDVFSQIDSLRKEHGFLPENNLPERQNQFVGREQEISEIVEHLKRERLAILTGMGGVGKTRLAEKVASELLPSFPDGVWFVDLASLRDADLVLPAIASVLSIQPQPGTPLQQQITNFLKTKRLLLVLDNFEQLPHKAGILIEELIQNTQFFRCLVTSRDVSTCPYGEQFWVKPLETPPPGVIVSVDSVKLFLVRAEELRQPLPEEHLKIVAELCRILDGIPLAIELTAARLADLSLEEILVHIKEQVPLQVDESTVIDPRHQKLQSVLSWSYDLLTETEQELFAQLSVFSGGFFTEAVEKICTGKHVLGNLFSLRAKSLVQAETVQQKKRYFLLEPVRQYAAERLGKTEENIRKAHAGYFLSFAKERDEKLKDVEKLKGVEQGQVLSEMALELDNFRAAMDFAQEQGQGEWELLGKLGVALCEFFQIRGLWSEGIQYLRQMEEALRNLGDEALLANALHGLGIFYQLRGNSEIAQNLYTESLQIRRKLWVDKRGIANLLTNLGIIAGYQGAYDEARQLYTESLQIKRELGDKWGIPSSLVNLGSIAYYQGLYDEARQFLNESLQIRRNLGDKLGAASSLGNLGLIALNQGAYDEARQFLNESLQIRRKLGDKLGIASSLENLGIIAGHQGAYEEARKLRAESLQIRRKLGDKLGIASLMNDLGVIALDQGAYDEARQLLNESLQIRRDLGDKRGTTISLVNLGEIARCQGAYDEARQFLTRSLQILRELRDKWCIAYSFYQFGKLAEAEGDSAQAVLFLLYAARLYDEMQAADSKYAVEVQEALTGIQEKISAEQLENIKQQADAMSVDDVVELALSWGE
jgi:predicted ATPase/Tfp pilus assembly protein PilF